MATITKSLIEKKWFQETSEEIKDQLIALNGDYDGFCKFLGDFPDRVGDVNVLRLEKLAKCEFSMICPVFAVCKDGGRPFSYEFASWKMGEKSGSKGLIFLREAGKIIAFVLLRQNKFAIHRDILNAVGGFAENGDLTLSDTMKREITEEVGIPSGNIETIDLGGFYPDAGMVNSHVQLFAGILDVNPKTMHNNSDLKELGSSTAIFPITMLRDVVTECEDSFFLACIAKLWAKGILPLTF